MNGQVISVENATIGNFLRALRKAQSLTLMQTAQQTGLHRSTLERWEKGETQPRLSELDALLTFLNADTRQRQEALQLVDAPRARRVLRSDLEQTARHSGMPPLPNGGDLLYAMRMRRGISREEAAYRVEVTAGTLRRWEKMEVWPSVEQLQRLSGALGAHEEEILALIRGQFSSTPRSEKSSAETILARLEELKAQIDSHPSGFALWELTFLQLEAEAWPLARASAAGKQALIALYAYHAQTLSTRNRLVEADRIAEHAFGLMAERLKPERYWLYPAIVAARACGLSGQARASRKALEMLRPWATMTQWPDMHAWMLADMAKYVSRNGDPEAALTMAERACGVEGLGGEAILRHWDRATVLLNVGRPAEALEIVQERSAYENSIIERVDISLLRTETYLDLGRLPEAEDWLQRALNDVETHRVDFKRSQVERLAARFRSGDR